MNANGTSDLNAKFDLKSIELKEQLAAWWAAYLAIYAALQLDETMSDTQRERTAVERADLAMRVWQNKQRMLLNAEPETTLAEQIYLREKKRSEEEAAKTPKPPVLPVPIITTPVTLNNGEPLTSLPGISCKLSDFQEDK